MKKFWIFPVLLLMLTGCERDDLCLQQPVPHTVIRLRDYTTGRPKPAQSLTVSWHDQILFSASETDSVAFYLPPQDGPVDLTFSLQSDTVSQADTVIFDYQLHERFLSKACGFGLTFDSLRIQVIDRGAVWIKRVEVLQPGVETDTLAHANFYY